MFTPMSMFLTRSRRLGSLALGEQTFFKAAKEPLAKMHATRVESNGPVAFVASPGFCELQESGSNTLLLVRRTHHEPV